MKKTVLTAFLAISVITALANPIDENQASKLARQFLGGKTYNTRAATPANAELKHLDVAFAKDYLHVFNIGQEQGYVIVASDDNVGQPILGYSDRGALTEAEMPVNMRNWLSSYVDQMKWISQHPENKSVSTRSVMPKTRAGNPIVEPLLGEIAWGQGEPYNLMTPIIGDRHALTGCVATATAQIMYYHRWPEQGTGSKTYHDPASNQDVSTNFAEHSYDWSNMTPRYDSNSSEASRTAVAQLMFDAGVAIEMQYSLSNSLTYTPLAAEALAQYFGYDERVYYLARRNVSGSTWEQVMQNELNAHRPMIYSGSAEGAADGHAFVCDGYDNEGYYHFNWGWEGSYNGWFLLTTMNPGNNSGYVADHEMVCNIARPGHAGDRLTENNVGTFEFDAASGQLTIQCIGDQSNKESAEEYPWYQYKDQVKSVIFTQGITSIGNFVFDGYTNLKNVTIPEGVEMIGYYAFQNCPIESIEMPESLVTICGGAFAETNLVSVTFGRNIANIANAFKLTPSLKDCHVSAEHPRLTSVDGVIYNKNLSTLVYLPSGREKFEMLESVERIGDFAVAGSCMTEAIIPDAIIEIGAYAFSDCMNLKKITLPKHLSVIQDGLLNNCYAIEEINFGKNISIIGSSLLTNANSIKDITFPASLKSIGSWVLNHCEKLTNITCLAKVAPALGEWAFQLVGYGEEATLNVPRGSDYSAWIAMLGPNWKIQYFDPVEEELENSSVERRGWVGYASSGYTTDISVGWTQPFRSDVAIFLSNSSNSIDQGLEVEGRTLYSLAIMGGRDKPISGKAWISTKLPENAEDADICIFDIDCSTMARFEYSEYSLPEPVVIPQGGCYIGFTFESEGNSFPFNCDQQYIAGLAFSNSCFVRSTNELYKEWTDINNQYFATIKYQLKRQFFEHDVVPVSAMHTSAFVGKAATTTMSLSSIGLSTNVGTIGLSIYNADSGSWGDVVDYKVDRDISVGAQSMIDITIPAAQKAGNLVDSVKIVKIDGLDNPSKHVAIPIYLCNVANPIPHHVVVNNYISKKYGETMSAFVSSDLLKKEFGDDVIIINSLKQDPVVPEFCSPIYVEKLTTYIDEFSYEIYHPYKGLKSEGFGIAEEVRKALSVPATIEISAEAEWTDIVEVQVISKLHTLADIDPKSLKLQYFVLADSLHGTGADWRQLNSYSGTSTDDPNLAPLTKMPEYIDGLYYNNVSMITNTFFMDGDLYIAPEKAGSVFSIEKTLNLNFDYIHDPSMFGYQEKDLKILVGVYDIEKNKLVNTQVVNLKAKSIEENQIKAQVYNSSISLECSGIAPYFHVKLYNNETTFADMVVNKQQVETASFAPIIFDVPEGSWTLWVRPANSQMEDVGDAITQAINVYRLHDLYAYSDRSNIQLVFDSSAPIHEISVYNEAEGKYTHRFTTSDKSAEIKVEQGLFFIYVKPMDEDYVIVGDGGGVSVSVGNEDCSVRDVTTETENKSLHLTYVSDAPYFHITIIKDGSSEIFNDIIWDKELNLSDLENGVYSITITALDSYKREINDATATLSFTVDDSNGIGQIYNDNRKEGKYLQQGKILIKTKQHIYDLEGKKIK